MPASLRRAAFLLLATAGLGVPTTSALDHRSLCTNSPYLFFAPAELISAGGATIAVPGYSVPSYSHWNDDELEDLVVGEGVAEFPGKVRVYLNSGTPQEPLFSDYFYVQADGADLEIPAQGCLGTFPRVVYWDADSRKDLLIGRPEGTVELYLNIGTDAEPTFDGGTLLQVGDPGEGEDIDVFFRAAPTAADWNNDGRKDLVVGSVDGLIYLYLNEGTDPEPLFRSVQYAQMQTGELLTVQTTRSSPHFIDLDGDGVKDLLTGDRDGQLLFFRNCGSAEAPVFSPDTLVRTAGVPVDLLDLPRSRPFVCDWDHDGRLDILVGAGDGLVRLYRGIPRPGDLDLDGVVTFADASVFFECLAGPEITTPPPGVDPAVFALADTDGDADVDVAEVAILQLTFGSAD